MINIRKLEADLWESADLLRAGSKLTSNQYCMPVLGLIFLRYAYSRFKLVESEILKNRPARLTLPSHCKLVKKAWLIKGKTKDGLRL